MWQLGVARFAVVANCRIGLHPGEIVNALRAHDAYRKIID